MKKHRTLFLIGRIGICVTILTLVMYFISLISGFNPFYETSAYKNALLDLMEDSEKADEIMQQHYDNLYEIGDKLSGATSTDEVIDVLKEYTLSDAFGDLRYFSYGKRYDTSGLEDVTELDETIAELAKERRQGCTAVYFDAPTKYDCIAFYVPITGCDVVDGLLSIVPARRLVDLSGVINENSKIIALIDTDGKILADAVADDADYYAGNNYFDFIKQITHSNSDSSLVMSSVNSGEANAVHITVDGNNYTVASQPLLSANNQIILISMSDSEVLNDNELTYVRHILIVLIIAIISLIISVIYAFLFHRQSKKELSTANLTDPTTECANAEQFRITTMNIIHKSEAKRYVVVAFEIRQYHYVSSMLGEANVRDLLKFIVKIIGNFCDENETFGYSGEGRFYILYRFGTERALKDRLKLIDALINKNDLLTAGNISLKFNIGICPVYENKRHTVMELMEYAARAADQAKTNVRAPYIFYTEEINKSIVHNEKIEAQMETALQNGDFKIFLQPKYNVLTDSIDSAEALVRWFDPSRGDYIFPGEFINLFETNGFITKLDHYVYLEVMRYFEQAEERGDKVVPISVNVSRVTATSPDFLDFYVGNKKRHGIGDGFITLEFTESFAMEDYETISEIVETLHKNGMKCSIDDFGSGYSSFNILKNIPMDELKLDRFFLNKGYSIEKDNQLIETVIKLAKSMNMTVVQEGVENKDMFDRVVGMGCDVIQGYYYAKAISLEEYKIFLTTNTSIKYKAKVK